MGNYFRSPEMQSGKGFRCPNCTKLLAVKLLSPSNVSFHCPRCKAFISVKMREPVPWAQQKTIEKKEEEKKEQQAAAT
jgi:phage FluMu protein Com